MAGGLMQLVAYGAQDVFLTEPPKLLSGKYLTDVTLTLLWKALNKPFWSSRLRSPCNLHHQQKR